MTSLQNCKHKSFDIEISLCNSLGYGGDEMTVNDLVHDFVLQLLRRGHTVATIAQALADQKVKLMQADEYFAAAKEADKQP